MSERYFRIVMGVWLVTGLYLNIKEVIYALIVMLIFEGVTNLRIPSLITRLGLISDPSVLHQSSAASCFSFEAERGMRFVIAFFILLPMLPGLEIIWWLPWFVGFALIGAGLSGICPMVMVLRYVGLR